MGARLWEKGKRGKGEKGRGKEGKGAGHVVGARSASADCGEQRGEQGGECSGFATP